MDLGSCPTVTRALSWNINVEMTPPPHWLGTTAPHTCGHAQPPQSTCAPHTPVTKPHAFPGHTTCAMHVSTLLLA
jgi:hypothetical protein